MKKPFFKSKLALPVIIALGIAVMITIIKLQPPMQHNLPQRPSTPVSYISVIERPIKPEIIGYGTVKPDLSLKAKAEVTGRITFVNPDLKKGEIFLANTLLIKIDDKDYQLQVKQAHADVLAHQANLKEMQLTIENNKLELKLAQQKLNVRQKEYKRLKTLRKSGSVSQSKLDAEYQNLLQQKQEVQQQKNKQTTLPSDLEVMKAQLAIGRAKLQRSQRDLERTEIKLPFNGRISSVSVELDQYVATGAQLFSASGLNKIVINAQFPLDQFRLFSSKFKKDKIQVLSHFNFSNMPELLSSLGLTAQVEMASGHFPPWTAKVERFSDDLDPLSRTLGVTVSIVDNYKNIKPGEKPPLLEGMYMRVSLMGAASNFIAVPRFAIRENQLYRITNDNTLERLTVSDVQMQGNLALLNAPLKSGDRIITSDVFPAVNGMALTPQPDKAVEQQMLDWLGEVQ